MSRVHARRRVWARENGWPLDGYGNGRPRVERMRLMSERRRRKMFRMVNKRLNTWVWQQRAVR